MYFFIFHSKGKFSVIKKQDNTTMGIFAQRHEKSNSLQNNLKPMFDLIRNACGFPRSLNFDKDGNWIASKGY